MALAMLREAVADGISEVVATPHVLSENDLLKDEKLTTAEVNRKFLDILSSRNVRRMPAGSVIEGRRYDEEVFLFNEH